MKLFAASASPFVRKVRAVAMEAGLDDQIEQAVVATAPHKPDASLAKVNPVKKIPTLVTDEGDALYDSGVITEYLNSRSGHRLMPAEGRERWAAKQQESLADGLMDAAVLIRYETAVRPDDKRWDGWVEAQTGKIDAALDQMNADAASLGDPAAAGTTLGAVSTACALGYLDFRFADRDWRPGRNALATWYESYANRPAMRATEPNA